MTPQNLTPLSAAPADLTALGGTIDGSEVVVFSFPYSTPVALDVLTPAEREVIAAVLGGRSNADVARARGTSARTVAVQLSKAFRKLRVRGRGELAAAISGGHL